MVAVGPGSCVVVLTADCAPVALGSPEGVHGAVHVGWRGLVAGVIAGAVDAMRALGATDVVAGLGPTIHPCCYAFGGDDLAAVAAVAGGGVRSVTSGGEPALDLPAAVRARLDEAGARLVVDVDRCTACGGDAFSHRARGDEARQALFVWRGEGGRGPVSPPAPLVPAPAPAVVAARVEEVWRRVRRSGRDPDTVRLVAVTKGFDVTAVTAALAAGVSDIGENYAAELLSKAEILAGHGARSEPAPCWHFLGAVQRRRVRRLAPVVGCWQTLARAVEGEAIAGRAPGALVFVEVDTSGLPGRNGCPPAGVPGLVGALRQTGSRRGRAHGGGAPRAARGHQGGVPDDGPTGRRSGVGGGVDGDDAGPRDGPRGGHHHVARGAGVVWTTPGGGPRRSPAADGVIVDGAVPGSSPWP